RLDLLARNAQQSQGAFHRIGTALPKREVVLAAAALIAIAFHAHLHVFVLEQKLRMRLDHSLIFLLDVVGVEVVIDAAFGQRVVGVLQHRGGVGQRFFAHRALRQRLDHCLLCLGRAAGSLVLLALLLFHLPLELVLLLLHTSLLGGFVLVLEQVALLDLSLVLLTAALGTATAYHQHCSTNCDQHFAHRELLRRFG